MSAPVLRRSCTEKRRFDITTTGDANLDLILYGLPTIWFWNANC
jgi:hypothetical protein